ncbi:hypothetical protein NE237_011352 [Protea cynaroides]|uniref:Uncharacterized protein n=1 Tax=Protea cynaroides TaxID=273540 RepID=A0A9Q0GVW5_9MAGN|nr:hypothetical protein NE237_011352 [Protea cynaroides]
MQRSSSRSRASEEFFAHHKSLLSSSQAFQAVLKSEISDLPTYNPLSEAAKKEKSRIRFAENAVHVIPLVLVLCAFIVWFFSNPESKVNFPPCILRCTKREDKTLLVPVLKQLLTINMYVLVYLIQYRINFIYSQIYYHLI